MAGSTFTWIGNSGSALPADDPLDWSPSGPPHGGDSAIINAGTLLFTDAGIQAATIYLESATLEFFGTGSTTPQNPTLDSATVITSNVSAAETPSATPTQTVVDAFGTIINQGTIDAAGPAGSSFTIAIAGTTIGGTYYPGYFFNDSSIIAEAGNSLTISIAGTAELFNTGVIAADGGTIVVNASSSAIAGGYAPVLGFALIDGGGTLETNVGYASTVSGTAPFYAFAGGTPGNTLKIDNIGSFGGRILGFGANDTIDLGTSLSVGKLAYSSATGILALENAGGTILASVVLASGPFASGTFAVSGTIANGITIGTGADGDTILTTAAQNPAWNSTSGTWQTAGSWSTGAQPGTLDTALIGIGASNAFTLTTGSTPVSAGGLLLVDKNASLQITSNTTIAPYAPYIGGGTLEVTGGNTLQATGLRLDGGTVTIDAAALIELTGHPNVNLAASNGTVGVANGNTAALAMTGGTLLVNGGTLDAGTTQSVAGANGGDITIGGAGQGGPAAVIVQNSGTATGIVRDTHTELYSDPTSFGAMTLDGTVSWTDMIDPNDTLTTRGYIDIGVNSQAANTPVGVTQPLAGAAQLLIENGATLTEQSFARIGQGADSVGTVTVESGGVWSVGMTTGGYIAVGNGGTGELSVLAGGTVLVGNTGTFFNNGSSSSAGGLGIGTGSGGAGTVSVSGQGALLQVSGGVAVGKLASGELDVLNGGTVSITANAVTVGRCASFGGSVVISGTDAGSGNGALLTLGAATSGLTIGGVGNGTVTVGGGGTIQVNGTRGIAVGQNTGVSGLLTVGGTTGLGALVQLGSTVPGMSVGQAGQGTLDITSGGTVIVQGASAGVGLGTTSGGNGAITVSGGSFGAGVLTVQGGGIGLGEPGSGTLTVNAGGTVSAAGGILVGISANAAGSITVTGGSLTSGSFLSIGNSGTGIVTVTGGVVNAGTNAIGIGNQTGGNGSLSVSGSGLLEGGLLLIDNTASGTATGALDIGIGGSVQVTGLTENANATVSVTGGTLTSTGGISIGLSGTNAALTVNGGLVQQTGSVALLQIGGSSATGSVAVSGSGTLSAAGGINVGGSGGSGTLTVNGGSVSVGSPFRIGNGGTAGVTVNGGGTVTVTGTQATSIGSALGGTASVSLGGGSSGMFSTSGGALLIGSGGNASVFVQDGGTLSTTFTGSGPAADINATGSAFASVSVSGIGASWTITATGAQLIVGDDGNGALFVGPGGVVNAGSNSVDIGNQPGGSGTVSVTGAGALLEGGTLDIANASATGTLSVASGATVDASGLVIGASGVVTLQGGVLSVSGIVSQNSGNITGFGTIAGALTNTGTMLTQSGTLDVAGAIGGAGAITIAGGTALEVDGVLGDSQSVTFDTSVAAGNLVLGSLQASNGFALQNWQNGDELIINNGATITGSNWLGGGTLAVFTSAGTYDFTNVTLAAGTSPVFNTGANFVELVSCFAEGTLIRTANGDVPVEQLAVGDMLPTALDGRMRPIVWIGHRTVRCDTHPKPEQVLPVRIRAGAFGPGLPQWDLVLSPEHAVYVDGVLIPVRKLVNGTTVAFQQVTRVTYYHVELPRHDVLYAEGMPAESYLDLGDRDMYFNGKVVRLHTVSIRHHDTDLAAVWESMGCAPLVQSGPLLAAVRQRLELSELVHEERLRA